MDVWTTVKDLLKKKTLKKADFAKKMGVSRQTIDNWISGSTHPNQLDLTNMSNILAEIKQQLSIDKRTDELVDLVAKVSSNMALEEEMRLHGNDRNYLTQINELSDDKAV